MSFVLDAVTVAPERAEGFEAWTASHAFAAGHRPPGDGGAVASANEIRRLEVVQAAYGAGRASASD